MSTLALFVLLLGVVVGLAVVVGLGYLVYRRPALKTPVMVAVTAAGVLIAFAVGVVSVAQASAREVMLAPASRCRRQGTDLPWSGLWSRRGTPWSGRARAAPRLARPVQGVLPSRPGAAPLQVTVGGQAADGRRHLRLRDSRRRRTGCTRLRDG